MTLNITLDLRSFDPREINRRDEMTISYQRILVPLDGSEFAARALPHAEALTTLTGAHLVLLQVIPSAAMLISETAVGTPGLGLPTVDPFLSAAQYEAVEETLANDAKTTLDEAAAPLLANSLQVETVILKGAPADAILTYAKEEKIDLIIMSTHGRSGLARMVYGSVAENVLRHATCPILLVRVTGE
jgi:nucleotide-binding universal stress UspA family protein